MGEVIGEGCMPEVDLDLVFVTWVETGGVAVTSVVTLGGLVFRTSTIFSSGFRCFIFLFVIFSAASRETRDTPRVINTNLKPTFRTDIH